LIHAPGLGLCFLLVSILCGVVVSVRPPTDNGVLLWSMGLGVIVWCFWWLFCSCFILLPGCGLVPLLFHFWGAG